jgi:hypothetical protein
VTGESPVEEAIRTRRQAVAAALRIALAEQEMGGVPTRAMKADDTFAFACLNHVRAIEALPRHLRPKGWNEPAAGAA